MGADAIDPVLKSISEYGVTLVALVALASLALFFIRDLIRQRDAWRAIAESAVSSFDRLTDQLDVDIAPIRRPRHGAAPTNNREA